MNTVMPIGVDDFAEVRQNYYFVDKTTFLRHFFTDKTKVTLLTRPRRFGKTLFLSMLYYFLDIEAAQTYRGLFTGLAVAGDATTMAQQGSRPVLFITLKEWKYPSWVRLQSGMQRQLSKIFRRYQFLLDDAMPEWDRADFLALIHGTADIDLCQDALAFLLRLLEEHYGTKPVLLLDEYDVPLQNAWEQGYYQEAIEFFREFFSVALKSNPSLDFAVLTGVLRIAKESIFSDLNNLFTDSMLAPELPAAMGFTEAEVTQMAADLGKSSKLAEIRDWYDGYRLGGQEIYNPWSVIWYFKKGCVPDTYWVNTSGNAILAELLRQTDQEHIDALAQLLQGGTVQGYLREGIIYNDIGNDDNALYTLLCLTGYLTITEVQRIGNLVTYTLRLPNREMQTLFGTEILARLPKGFSQAALVRLLQSLLAGNAAQVQAGLATYLETLASTYDTAQGKEAFYHGFVLGLTALLVPDYTVRSNRESGHGRYDIAVFPRRQGQPGLLLEFKVAATEAELSTKAQEALQQINTRDYDAEFRAQGVAKVLHYGIAFCGKRVLVGMK